MIWSTLESTKSKFILRQFIRLKIGTYQALVANSTKKGGKKRILEKENLDSRFHPT